jgi:AcrR family transcriptional regulator
MKKKSDTKSRVLESAAALFSSKGYADTSLVDICEGAGANKAAVNYYFRTKENLYAEAWRMEFERSVAVHSLDGGVPASASVERRLYGHILSMGQRISDPNGREFEIIEKERANPTGLLAEIIQKVIEPAHRSLMTILTELLGEKAQPIHIRLCKASIMSQTMGIFLMEKSRGKVHHHPSIGGSIEDVADHITQFSLAGIRAMRKRIERGEA